MSILDWINDVSTTALSIIAGVITTIVIAIIGVIKSSKKDSVAANVLAFEQWRELYEVQERRVEKLEARIGRQDKKIEKQDKRMDKTDHELNIAKDYIQYLWLGTVENINFMMKLDPPIEPPFKPERNFRGDDDFDPAEWEWIGEKND